MSPTDAPHTSRSLAPSVLPESRRAPQADDAVDITGQRHIVLTVEIDRLDAFERLYGAAMGERLTEHVAGQIVGHCRVDDLVLARHGHGFTVLLPAGTSRHAAGEIASRLARAIGDPCLVDGRRLHVIAHVRVEKPWDETCASDDEDVTLHLP